MSMPAICAIVENWERSNLKSFFPGEIRFAALLHPGLHGNMVKIQVLAGKGGHPAVATDKSNPMMSGTQGK